MLATVINGDLSDEISILDRGLQYGDGVFETLAVIEGQPRHWDLHIDRLQTGCERLGIPAPPAMQLFDDLLKLPLDISPAVLKIIVTRGTGVGSTSLIG